MEACSESWRIFEAEAAALCAVEVVVARSRWEPPAAPTEPSARGGWAAACLP